MSKRLTLLLPFSFGYNYIYDGFNVIFNTYYYVYIIIHMIYGYIIYTLLFRPR